MMPVSSQRSGAVASVLSLMRLASVCLWGFVLRMLSLLALSVWTTQMLRATFRDSPDVPGLQDPRIEADIVPREERLLDPQNFDSLGPWKFIDWLASLREAMKRTGGVSTANILRASALLRCRFPRMSSPGEGKKGKGKGKMEKARSRFVNVSRHHC